MLASSTTTTSAVNGLVASCRNRGENGRVPSSRWIVVAVLGSRDFTTSEHGSSFWAFRIDSAIREAAFPVGAQIAMSRGSLPCASSRAARSQTTVRVFPVPGPPVITVSWRVAAVHAASFW